MSKKKLNIIFDCDGVLYDTNHKKKKYFVDVFKSLDVFDHNLFKNYIDINYGMKNRYMIFHDYSEKLDNPTINLLINKYASLTSNLYNYLRVSAYLKIFLKKNFKKCNFHILTSGRIDDIKTSLKKNGVFEYFTNMAGNEIDKYSYLKKFTNKKNALMIGDSLGDANAAYRAKLKFIYMYGYSNNLLVNHYNIKRKSYLTIRNFCHLLNFNVIKMIEN